MTRATLLHVLDHPVSLGPAEVRELEQLAQAFPYCQTAHLLLAKAAHDQGTMLAGQRLRRAATYAADRSLLRQLIEQVEPARPRLEEPHSQETDVPAEVVPVQPEASAPASLEPAAEIPAIVDEPAAYVAVATVVPAPPVPVLEVAAVAASSVVELIPTAHTSSDDSGEEKLMLDPSVGLEPVPLAEQVLIVDETNPTALLLDQENADIFATAAEPETFVEVVAEVEELPAQAPAVRPPVEVGEARFEFGLAEKPAAAVPNYELPGLVDEWAASAVTRGLGRPEALPELAQTAADTALAAAVFTPAAFTGDGSVGYALGESSRLGFSLQLLDLLTANAEASEAAAVLFAGPQAPATALPPLGAFFEPDSLLLDHWATHRPQTPSLPSSLDLINSFLRRQPRLTRPAMLPPTASVQADLSVRSTRTEPDLASESLARILVRQGKTARAIEIYEKLIVRHPEKMAYFAAQIQQLHPPA